MPMGCSLSHPVFLFLNTVPAFKSLNLVEYRLHYMTRSEKWQKMAGFGSAERTHNQDARQNPTSAPQCLWHLGWDH